LNDINILTRSVTVVIPVSYLTDLLGGAVTHLNKYSELTLTSVGLYNDKSDIDASDRSTMLPPMAIARLMANQYVAMRMTADPSFFNDLDRAGFLVDRNIDMMQTIFERGGKHYLDMGVSKKIVDGLVGHLLHAITFDITDTFIDPNENRCKANQLFF
jgi:hypothetical protein